MRSCRTRVKIASTSREDCMRPVRFVIAAAVAALVFTALPSRAEDGKIVRSFPFSDKETKVGVKSGDALIGSFRIRHWPDPENMAKGEKDLNDNCLLYTSPSPRDRTRHRMP